MLRRHHWLRVVPILLLALWLAGPRLNALTFNEDETRNLIYTGARNFGPLTPAEALAAEQGAFASDQAFGWTILVNLWGGAVGWSTVAIRALPLFFGLLTVALLYRAGRDLCGRIPGLYAALLLISYALVVQYFHIARAYTPSLFFTTLTLWSYWRVAVDPRPAGRRWAAGLLVGGVGLLYIHYFAALHLGALGLFHLLALRKDRRWRRTTLLLALILLSATPELVALRAGVAGSVGRYGSGAGLDLDEALLRLLYMFSNGVIDLPRGLAPALLLLLPAALAVLLRSRPRQGAVLQVEWYLGVCAAAFFCLVMAVNHFVPVLSWPRMRYLLALWPPVVLLVAAGIHRLGRRRQRMADRILAALATSGIVVIMLTPAFRQIAGHTESIIHLADQALVAQAGAGDYLVIEEQALPWERDIRRYYLHVWTWPRAIVAEGTEAGATLQEVGDHARIWLLAAGRDGAIEEQLSGGLQMCRRPVNRGSLALTLYARDEADCG